MNHSPITRDLVLLGGGHAHVEVLRRMGMQPPIPGVRLTLISRELHTPYSGMLPGLIAGHYTFDEAHIDLGPLAHFANARLFHDEVTGLDLERKRVLCRNRPPVAFDVLSIDTGSTPTVVAPGATTHAVPIKPVSTFNQRWEQLRHRVLERRGKVRIGVVGGGAGGVEMLMAVRHRLQQDCAAVGKPATQFHFVLFCASDNVLPQSNARVRALYQEVLRTAGVEVKTRCHVSVVELGRVHTQAGDVIEVDEILWATHAAAPPWPRAAGLATDDEGFIRVSDCLQSISHASVFAAGDVANVAGYPRPKSGVFAVRQGPPLTENLRRVLRGAPLAPFKPQRRFLSLISTGGRHAVAARGGWACAGDWVWRWKDRIDRRFMRRYSDLTMPAMSTTTGTAPEAAMRCGGCGSKLGAELLREALTELHQTSRAEIVIGLEQPDDAALVRLPPHMLAVQTVDAFRSFVEDPWLFGRITAAHCLSDIFAMGATPQTALAIANVPLADPRKMRDDLLHMMSGALEVLAAEGVSLVGGHTTEGAELSLGFAINGYVAEHAVLRKRGAQPAHALILTKPLGSGVLLAGAMRGQTKSRWLEAAYACMSQSNGPASRCLREHGAAAMTDVTGFGLLGHLLEMLSDDGPRVALDLAQIPMFDGAVELASLGIRSSLYPDNAHALSRVTPAEPISPRLALSCDPQTAGGLLAALPRAQADACLRALHALGFERAAVIGEFIEAAPGARIVVQSA